MADTPSPTKQKMELGNVPLLGALVLSDPKDRERLEQEIKAAPRGTFVGKILMEKFGVTPHQLDEALLHQSDLKTNAAIHDIAAAQAGTTLDAGRTQTTFGFNGVVPAVKEPTRTDAGSAVANMMQNIALIVKDHPEAAKSDEVKAAIGAAQHLQGQLAHSGGRIDARADMALIDNGLRTAVKLTGHEPKDGKGNAVSIDDYIKARTGDVVDGAGHEKEKTRRLGKDEQDISLEEAMRRGISLQRGDHGKAVEELQQKLHIPADKDFGPETQKALLKAQQAAIKAGVNLGDTGVRHDGADASAGKDTVEALSKLPKPVVPTVDAPGRPTNVRPKGTGRE